MKRRLWFLASSSVFLALLASILGLALVDVVANSGRPIELAWLQRLDDAGLKAAASHIEDYPVSFRLTLIDSVSPELRRQIWDRTIERYIRATPALRSQDIEVIRQFNSVRAEPRQRWSDEEKGLRDVLLNAVGPDAYDAIATYAGPASRNGDDWVALPLRIRLEGFIRSKLSVRAGADDCNCNNPGSDCKVANSTCPFAVCNVKFDKCGGGSDCVAICKAPA